MFTITTDAATVAETSGSSYISKSGIYDVTIKHASISKSPGGSEKVIFNINWDGNDQTIYGPCYKNNDGNPNTIGTRIYNKLGIIVGMREGDRPTIQQETHAVGPNKEQKELAVIQEFTDQNVKFRLQEEYTCYNGQIRKSMEIRNVFHESGASANEILSNGTVGEDLEKEQKYASNVTYKDGLTAEDVAEWKASKSKDNAATTPKASTNKAAAPLFG